MDVVTGSAICAANIDEKGPPIATGNIFERGLASRGTIKLRTIDTTTAVNATLKSTDIIIINKIF